MISYDQYENKIKKYAKFRGVMNRFKFLFIALFALIAGAVATLLALMGSFSGEIKMIDTVMYGEGYEDPEGVTAFLSSVSYEYAREGSDEWSSEKPVKAGKYSVRAVSKKAIGKGYGKTASFEITKRAVEFSILSNSVRYGDVPEDIALQLLEGDRLDKSALLFTYEDYTAERTNVDLIESSVKILNGTDDRSDCYTIVHTEKMLDITKRDINVALFSMNFTYSGEAITYAKTASEETEEDLANRDVIRIGTIELRKDGQRVDAAVYAGEYEAVILDFRIVKVISSTEEYDVTHHYAPVNSAYSTFFTIGKKLLTITTESARKPYDGEELSNHNYTKSELAKGDSFNLESWVDPILNAGSVQNAITYTITNSDGYDVRDNYEIECSFGTLTITPRKVTVKSESSIGIIEYDGREHGHSVVTMEDDIFEAVADPTPLTRVKTVKASVANIVLFTIHKKGAPEIEEDFNNFDIDTQWGRLQLAQRDITITIESLEKLYDGQPLFATFENGKASITQGQLAEGDGVQTGELHVMTDVRNVGGEVKSVENSSTYRIFCGFEDRTDCYNIEYERGTLTITPRHITIFTQSEVFPYDGNAHFNDGYTVYENNEPTDVIDGNLELIDTPTFTNFVDTDGKTKNNELKFRITDNYVVDSYDYGTITINKRPIHIKPIDWIVPYGEEYAYDVHHPESANFKLTDGTSFVNSDSVHISVEYVIDCEVKNNHPPVKWSKSGAIDYYVVNITNVDFTQGLSSNYDLHYEIGALYIVQRILCVYMQNAQTYYGEDLQPTGIDNIYGVGNVYPAGTGNYNVVVAAVKVDGVTTNKEGLLEGDKMEITQVRYFQETYQDSNGIKREIFMDPKNAAEYYIKPYELRFYTAYGDEVMWDSDDSPDRGNYFVQTYGEGKLTVAPRPIVLTLNKIANKTYDGEASDYVAGGEAIAPNLTYLEEGAPALVYGESLSVKVTFTAVSGEFYEGKPTFAGDYTYSFDEANSAIDGVSGVDGGLDNYVIAREEGEFTIAKRTVTVRMNDLSFVYGERPVGYSKDIYAVVLREGSEDFVPNERIYAWTYIYFGDHFGAWGEGEPSVGTYAIKGIAAGITYCYQSDLNVIDSYDLTVLDGELEVTPFEVSIDVYQREAVYGELEFETPVSNGYRVLQELPYNERISLEFAYSQNGRALPPKNVGTYNTVVTPVMSASAGEGGLNNYRIFYQYLEQRIEDTTLQGTTLTGGLEIKPLAITVSAKDDVRVMYGDAITEEDEKGYVFYSPLPYGESLKAELIYQKNGETIAPKYADTYIIVISGLSVLGDDASMENYDVSHEGALVNGMLEIYARPITVKLHDLTKIYGDAVRYQEGEFFTLTSGSLAVFDGIADVLTVTPDYGAERPSVGSYSITVQSWSITFNGAEVVGDYKVAESYDIEIVTGNLTIDKRPIVLTLNEIEDKKYDGDSVEYVSGGELIELAPAYIGLLDSDLGLVYGETLRVGVMFSSDGESYTNIKPIFAGSYQFRFFPLESYIFDEDGYLLPDGLANYTVDCQDGSFEITKRTVIVRMNDLKLTYGDPVAYDTVDNYTVTGGDGFAHDEYILTWDSIDFGCAELRPSVGSYQITGTADGTGSGWISYWQNKTINVISCYSITMDTEKYGELSIEQFIVTVTVNQFTAVYGELENATVIANEYSIAETLPYGEILYFEFMYSQGSPDEPIIVITPKNVGLYNATLNPLLDAGIYTSSKTEQLKNYFILCVNNEGLSFYKKPLNNGLLWMLEGGLEITKLPITVTVQPQELYYGDPIGENSVTYTPELPYGETLGVELVSEKDGIEITPKYAGTYDIVIKSLYIIGNEAGLDNYDVDRTDALENGTLTIKPRPIYVRLNPLRIKYGEEVRYENDDGTNFIIVMTHPDSHELAYGDVLKIVPYFDLSETSETRPDKGNYTIRMKSYTILFEGQDTVDGFFVADSYDLKGYDLKGPVMGILTVQRRRVELTLNSIFDGPIYYDGAAHNYVSGGELIEGDGMAEGEKLIVAVKYYSVVGTSETEVAAIAKAGEYIYEFDLENSSVENGGLKGLDNYSIYVSSAQCTILQRSISVELYDIQSQEYGTPVYYNEGAGNYKNLIAVLPEGDGLVDGEELELFIKFCVRGNRQLAFDNGTVLSFGDYEIVAKDKRVTGGEYADADNYIIEIPSKYFSITKRNVTVTLSEVETSYGVAPAYPQGEKNYAAIENLAENEILTVTGVAYDLPERAVVNVYVGAVSLTAIKVRTQDGEDVTANYTFDYVAGDVRVNPRDIVVATNGHTFVYDGEAHSDGGYTVYYVDQDGNRTEAFELPYGDKSALHDDYTGEGKLPSVTEYSEYPTRNEFAIVIMNGTVPVMSNYHISYVYNNILIEKLTLYVETKSYSKVYDGKPLEIEDGNIQSCYYYIDNNDKNRRVDGLIKDHEFEFVVPEVHIDVGTWRHVAVGDILDAQGNSVMHNYHIASYTYGWLTVEARVIYIDSSSASKPYDGMPLYSPDDNYIVRYYPNNDRSQTPLEGAEKVLVTGHAFISVTPVNDGNVGSVDNNPYGGVVVAATGEDVNGNYVLVFEGGTLTVTPRLVYYEIDSFEMDYCNAAPPEEIRNTLQIQKGNPEDGYGILYDEWDRFSFELEYYLGYIKISRYNAGEYTIKVVFSGSDPGINNYELQPTEGKVGQLIINKENLVLMPKGASAPYVSATQVINASESEYLFVDGTELAPGDVLEPLHFNRTSLSASEGRLNMSIKILKETVKILDGSFDATSNYSIMLLPGTIRFIARTVYYEQVVPEAIKTGANGRGIIPYTGTRYTVGDDDSVFKVLSIDDLSGSRWRHLDPVNATSYGLLSTDAATLRSATVGKEVNVYEKWAELNIFSTETGNKVTNFYEIILVMAYNEDTSIEVLAQGVNVTFSEALTRDKLDEAATGGPWSASSEYILSVSGLLEDHELEFVINKSEIEGETVYTIYIFIFAARYKNDDVLRTDKSIIYAVTAEFASGIASDVTLNVQLVDLSYYP